MPWWAWIPIGLAAWTLVSCGGVLLVGPYLRRRRIDR